MRIHGLLLTTFISAAAGVPHLSAPAEAATLAIKDPGKRRGAAIAQSFLDTRGENVSVVTTRFGASCIASRTLQISDSSYSGPVGADVLFNDVTRSPATSIQAIARPGAAVAFRIQLKYSPDRSEAIELDIGDRVFDVAPALEASSDSVLLEGGMARSLAEALRREAVPTLRATSDDTGRLVEDRIAAPDMTALDACLDTLQTPQAQNRPGETAARETAAREGAQGLDEPDIRPTADVTLIKDFVRQPGNAATPVSEIDRQDAVAAGPSRPAMPEPAMGMRVDFVARPDPDARIAPNELENCRMQDIPEKVFLGRLTGVTGFFSQTRDVYVAFDDDGQVQRAYIPGIFDSDLTAGRGRARASVAADSNLPDRPNTVKGCLGDAPLAAPVCVISGDGDDHYSLVECGAPGLTGPLSDIVAPILAASLAGPPDVIGIPDATPSLPGGGGGSLLPPGDDPPIFSELGDPDDDSPDPDIPNDDGPISDPIIDPVAPVPLPATLWMLIGSLGGFFLFRASGQKKRSRPRL